MTKNDNFPADDSRPANENSSFIGNIRALGWVLFRTFLFYFRVSIYFTTEVAKREVRRTQLKWPYSFRVRVLVARRRRMRVAVKGSRNFYYYNLNKGG